jgi:hypothetical protein
VGPTLLVMCRRIRSIVKVILKLMIVRPSKRLLETESKRQDFWRAQYWIARIP